MMAAYQKKQATARELVEMYSTTESNFYRLLQLNGVATHRNKNGAPVPEVTVVPEETEVPIKATRQMQVVVDKNDMVQSVQPIRRVNMSTWEVKYTGSAFVEAETVEEAIAQARKLGVVKRIYSVRVK